MKAKSPNSIDVYVGNRVRVRRKTLGMTQHVAPSYISTAVTGPSLVAPATLRRAVISVTAEPSSMILIRCSREVCGAAETRGGKRLQLTFCPLINTGTRGRQ